MNDSIFLLLALSAILWLLFLVGLAANYSGYITRAMRRAMAWITLRVLRTTMRYWVFLLQPGVKMRILRWMVVTLQSQSLHSQPNFTPQEEMTNAKFRNSQGAGLSPRSPFERRVCQPEHSHHEGAV